MFNKGLSKRSRSRIVRHIGSNCHFCWKGQSCLNENITSCSMTRDHQRFVDTRPFSACSSSTVSRTMRWPFLLIILRTCRCWVWKWFLEDKFPFLQFEDYSGARVLAHASLWSRLSIRCQLLLLATNPISLKFWRKKTICVFHFRSNLSIAFCVQLCCVPNRQQNIFQNCITKTQWTIQVFLWNKMWLKNPF